MRLLRIEENKARSCECNLRIRFIVSELLYAEQEAADQRQEMAEVAIQGFDMSIGELISGLIIHLP